MREWRVPIAALTLDGDAIEVAVPDGVAVEGAGDIFEEGFAVAWERRGNAHQRV